MYRSEFFDNGDLVLTLEVEGNNRCEILKNILDSEWTQEGHFIIEEYELDDIFFNLLFVEMNPDFDTDIFIDSYYDVKYNEYLYKVKFYSDMGLTLLPFLSEHNKESNTIDIFDFFCESIKEKFEYDNDSLNIEYETKWI
jgi:hypothetical protein